jgi:hypothetical protein
LGTLKQAYERHLKDVANGLAPAEASPKFTPKPEPWPELVEFEDAPPPPPWPDDVLPEALQDFVHQAAWSLNVPEDFVGVPLLGAAGGAVGNSRRLKIGSLSFQPANTFLYIVGRPGSGKTPALEMVLGPIADLENALFRQWSDADKLWAAGDKAERGDRPVRQRRLVDDATTEALMTILAANPRGVILYRDELSALVAAFDQYKSGGKGQDRQITLKLWSGSPIINDRKSADSPGLVVLRPFCAIVGGLQPSVLGKLRGGPDDGFSDRFWGVYPKELPAVGAHDRDVSDAALRAWSDAVAALYELQSPDDGRPAAVQLTKDAKAEWARFAQAHADESNAPDFPDGLRGCWSKLRGGWGRFALIVHLLRSVVDGVPGTANPFRSDGGVVDGESARRASKLVAYFKGHAQKISGCADDDPRRKPASRLLARIESSGITTFSRRDAFRWARGEGCKVVDDVDRVLNLLTSHGHVRPSPKAAREGPGRPSGLTFDVHPKLMRSYPTLENPGQNGQNHKTERTDKKNRRK